MYNDTRIYEENETVSFKFYFNKNITIGFCIGAPLVLGLLSLLYFWTDIAPDTVPIKYDVVPLTLLNFGNGDGTGMSKGNLSAEGEAHKGSTPQSQLNDAEIAAKTTQAQHNAETDPTLSTNIKPVTNVASTDANKTDDIGNSAKNIGTSDGSIDGSGLGNRGRGMGLGEGFGEIEWGGGGNRMVLSKKPPRFPTGTNTSGEIRIKFRVKPDGTVSKMVILKKSDPAFENAALEALRQWRFNPIKDTVEMEGIIPFRFKLR
ncbi:MAG: energy transducer TonB [Ignavibacteria bacterium]|jgi:TonB family protein|nr:energy transducer TonB [Ignavibacteria bacterium]